MKQLWRDRVIQAVPWIGLKAPAIPRRPWIAVIPEWVYDRLPQFHIFHLENWRVRSIQGLREKTISIWDHQDAKLWTDASEPQPQMEAGGGVVLGEEIASHRSFPWILLLQPEATALTEQNVHLKHQETQNLGVCFLCQEADHSPRSHLQSLVQFASSILELSTIWNVIWGASWASCSFWWMNADQRGALCGLLCEQTW